MPAAVRELPPSQPSPASSLIQTLASSRRSRRGNRRSVTRDVVTTTPKAGWTLSDWQSAYLGQDLNPQCLLEWVQSYSATDPAWIQRIDPEQLRQELVRLNQRLETVGGNRASLPLFGIPFAVKDNIDAIGFDTTAACPAFAYRPSQDSTVVARLKAQGAIVVGKTNLDQFATGLVGTRTPYGVVVNAFDARYIAGGSSSGSASVVARGLVPFALGTDTAGSGRVPAAFNNIVGWKPTRGAWSTSGVVPACRTLDCVSVFTLTVADAHRLATLIEGFDPSDPYSRRRPVSDPHPQQGNTLRLAIPDKIEFFGDDSAKAAFEATLAALDDADVIVEPIRFEPFKELARLLYEGPWVAERLTVVEPLLLTSPNSVDPVVRGIVQQGRDYSAVQTFRVEYRRAALARSIALGLAPFDALLVPTTPTLFTINDVLNDPVRTNARLGTFTNFTNLADLCALAVPGVFRQDGLPAGVTLLAPAWHEAELVRVGTLIEGKLALPRGATKLARGATSADASTTTVTKTEMPGFEIAVVGAHLSGLTLNPQLQSLGATLVKETSTSASYRLYVLPNTTPIKPGMVRDARGSKINLEVWQLPAESFARFVSAIPAPLGLGNIELDDGHWVKGFICEPYALRDAAEITHFGGFREYLAALDNA